MAIRWPPRSRQKGPARTRTALILVCSFPFAGLLSCLSGSKRPITGGLLCFALMPRGFASASLLQLSKLSRSQDGCSSVAGQFPSTGDLEMFTTFRSPDLLPVCVHFRYLTLTTAIVLIFLGLCYFQPLLSFFRRASSCGSYQYPELLQHIFTGSSVRWAAGSFLLSCTRMTGLIQDVFFPSKKNNNWRT